MGGEKFVDECHFCKNLGSPPRGRGKAEPFKSLLIAVGITPARAGKRSGKSASDNVPRDHPRVGGEKFIRKIAFFSGKGSPPHGRGKGAENLPAITFHGITPAWAGKSD